MTITFQIEGKHRAWARITQRRTGAPSFLPRKKEKILSSASLRARRKSHQTAGRFLPFGRGDERPPSSWERCWRNLFYSREGGREGELLTIFICLVGKKKGETDDGLIFSMLCAQEGKGEGKEEGRILDTKRQHRRQEIFLTAQKKGEGEAAVTHQVRAQEKRKGETGRAVLILWNQNPPEGKGSSNPPHLGEEEEVGRESSRSSEEEREKRGGRLYGRD